MRARRLAIVPHSLGQVFENSEVGLAPPVSSGVPFAARWEAHQRPDGVAGIRSVANRHWLGQTMMGHIRAKGSAMSSWEGWEVDFERTKPILCCSANSNGGGWIHLNKTEKIVAVSASVEDKRAAPSWRFRVIGNSDTPPDVLASARPVMAVGSGAGPP